MRIAFDSRPTKDHRGVGRYARCLLEALRRHGQGEIVETHDPRRCDIYHSPWLEGSLLRSPVPAVVTLHDLIPLKRRSEYLRLGLRVKLRYLAVERATRVIVPTRAVAMTSWPSWSFRPVASGHSRGGGRGVLAPLTGRGRHGARALRPPVAVPAVGGRIACA